VADFRFEIGAEQFKLTIEPYGDGYDLVIGDRRYQVNGQLHVNGQIDLVIDGQHQRAYTATATNAATKQHTVWLAGQSWTVTPIDAQVQRPRRASQSSGGSLTATMPGQVRAILVAVGDVVASGDPLIILEAMKMELRISASTAGTVAQINCAIGEVVARGQLLIELTE
jgi:biotin carboxyl carrier protein